MYIKQGMRGVDIARKLRVDPSTVMKWLKKDGIATRQGGRISKKPSKASLVRMYWGRRMNSTEIAEEFGVARSVAYNWLMKDGIPLRSKGEAVSMALENKYSSKPSTAFLEKMYFKHKMSINDIAKRFGVADTTAHRWLRKDGIPLRTREEAMALAIGRRGSKKPSKTILKRMYLKQGMSAYDLARKFGVGHSTVDHWLKKNKIPRRSSSEGHSLAAEKTWNRWKLGEKDDHGKRPSKARLEKMYAKVGMSSYEIAEELGVSQSTVRDWLKMGGISSRA